MKKIGIISIIVVLAVSQGWAQKVGFGTSDPQAALHIAGTDSSIRIEGLNGENNAKNLGGERGSR